MLDNLLDRFYLELIGISFVARKNTSLLAIFHD